MSDIHLYLDEDVMERPLIQALRSRGVDLVTVVDVGREGQSDEAQLLWAASQNRVICSCNQGDFSRLHTNFITEGRVHAGIILIQQQTYSVGERLQGLLRLIATKSSEEMQNQLEFLSKYLRDEV